MKQLYCFCGRKLQDKWGFDMCPIHKQETFTPVKQRIGKYSGRSQRFKGKYEDY